MPPHFNFFQYLHRVRHQPSASNPSLVGGAGFQYQQYRAEEFFKANYNDSKKDWKQDWFFMKNLGNTIKEHPVKRPAQRPCWNAKLTDEELGDIEALKALVAQHKSQGLTTASITWSWISRRIQPMRARERARYNYMGEQDNDGLSAQPLSDEEILEKVRKIIHGVDEKPIIPGELSASI